MAKELVKLSRRAKTALLMGKALGFITDEHHYGEIKRGLLEAEKHYVESKNRKAPDA